MVEKIIRFALVGALLVANIYLIYSGIIGSNLFGRVSAQSDFEFAYDFFRIGIPVFMVSCVSLLILVLAHKEKRVNEVLKFPESILYIINALIPVALFFLL